MALKYPSSRDAQTPRFEFRPGVNSFPYWKGIQREPGDPASLDPNSIWTGVNIRFNGVSMLSRGGQSEWNDTPENGCIYGIFDFEGIEDGGPGGAVLVSPKSPIYNASEPYNPIRYDEGAATPYLKYAPEDNSSTILQKVIANSNSTTNAFDETNTGLMFASNCVFKLNGKLYGLYDGYSSGSGTFTGTPAVYEVTYSPSNLAYRKIFNLPERINYAFTVKAERDIAGAGGIDTVNDVSYLCSMTNAHVYRWSQSTGLTTESTGGPNYRMIGAKYRENLYFASRNSLRVRNSAGSYSNIALPALPGGVPNFFPLAMIVYQDKLYISGASYSTVAGPDNCIPTVLVYNGTAVTVARALPVSAFFFGIADSMEVAFGNLYVSYSTDSAVTTLLRIAKFDNTTWTDNFQDNINDGLGTQIIFSRLRFNGKDMLLNAVQSDLSGTENSASPCLLKSNGSDFSAMAVIANPSTTDKCAFGDLCLMDQS